MYARTGSLSAYGGWQVVFQLSIVQKCESGIPIVLSTVCRDYEWLLYQLLALECCCVLGLGHSDRLECAVSETLQVQ